MLVNNRYKAVITFVGETQFKPGVWYGVELERERGKHNGTVSVRGGPLRARAALAAAAPLLPRRLPSHCRRCLA